VLKIINYNEIKKYKLYIFFYFNTNSKLYFDKDTIHKVMFYYIYDLQNKLNYIDSLNLEGIIKLKNLIEKDNKIVGYSSERYRDYKSLRKNENRSINLKIDDCLKIIELFNILNEKNVMFGDFNRSNILLNPKDSSVKICDLDNIEISNKQSHKKDQLRSVAILCLMYLYNLNYADILFLLREQIDINKDNIINSYFKSMNENNLEDFSSVIKKLDIDIIDENKYKIKTKVKELRKNSYYERYYL